tara:strand:- start:229 stop:498 length:270 start_codon:yes stop_codon:yes gene_type:complete
MRFKAEGASAAAGTSSGASSNVELATEVLVVNTAASGTVHLVTVTNSSGTTLGSFNLPGQSDVVLVKGSSDKIFAANAAVTLTPINTRV